MQKKSLLGILILFISEWVYIMDMEVLNECMSSADIFPTEQVYGMVKKYVLNVLIVAIMMT